MNALLGLLALLFAGGAALGGGSNASATASNTSAEEPTDASETSQDSATLSALSAIETAFYAEDGQLILEAESGAASGHWEQRTVDGERAMLWDADGNSYNTADSGEALSFEFVAEEAGTYFIAIHGGRVSSAMDPGDVRSDTGNDSYVKLTNLETGAVILDPTKLFIGLGDADEDLRWGNTFDKDHVKSGAQVALEEGTAYKLDLIGRSDGHVIDRVTLAKDTYLRDTDVDESALLSEQLALPLLASSEETFPADEEDVIVSLL